MNMQIKNVTIFYLRNIKLNLVDIPAVIVL